jgi:hypothetical protein
MVTISELASVELNKVLQSDNAKGKSLFVNFMGYG